MDLMQINLNQIELNELEAFLYSLSGPMAVYPEFLRASDSLSQVGRLVP